MVKASKKKPLLKATIVVVTINNLDQFYPGLKSKKPSVYQGILSDLQGGKAFGLVAQDTKSNKTIGSVWINRHADNLLTIHIKSSYRRRGVATQLISRLQADPSINHLVLNNIAGHIGRVLYKKTGFVSDPLPLESNRMVWRRDF